MLMASCNIDELVLVLKSTGQSYTQEELQTATSAITECQVAEAPHLSSSLNYCSLRSWGLAESAAPQNGVNLRPSFPFCSIKIAAAPPHNTSHFIQPNQLTTFLHQTEPSLGTKLKKMRPLRLPHQQVFFSPMNRLGTFSTLCEI